MDYWSLVNYTHLVFSTPLFIYIGYKEGLVHPWIYHLCLYLGIVLFLYHAFLTVKNFRSGNTMYVVNLFHVFVIAPLLIYVGVKKRETTYPIPTLMLILGIGGLYHYIKKLFFK
jgi:hypothetical protein